MTLDDLKGYAAIAFMALLALAVAIGVVLRDDGSSSSGREPIDAEYDAGPWASGG